MSLNVDDLDAVQLCLFRRGVPDCELWAEDPGLWALPMTRELYAAFASRRWYSGRPARLPQHLRDDPAEHQRFLARLRFERRLWQADYARRVRNATVALCKLECFRRVPAIMDRVLWFSVAPGPVFDQSVEHPSVFFCQENGDDCATIIGVTSFLQHVRQSHMQHV
jgi:hypothetical protein